MRSTLLLPLVALLLPAWLAMPAAAQSTDTRTLTVTASAEVRATPDRALVQLGVETQASTAQQAMAQNAQQMNRVIAAILALGIPQGNVQTSAVNLFPVYDNPRPGESPRLIGYRAQNLVAIEFAELNRVGMVLDAGIGAGANQLHGISFRLADDFEPRLAALTEASARAKRKAEAIAKGLGPGVTVGLVDSAVETVTHVSPISERSAAADSGTPILPGQLIIRAEVQVRYRIAQ
jgi:uncharacterized protein YggE